MKWWRIWKREPFDSSDSSQAIVDSEARLHAARRRDGAVDRIVTGIADELRANHLAERIAATLRERR